MTEFSAEDRVYHATKEFLKATGWQVIAGQPPSGTDHLPVVEIKSAERTEKGSGGAFKPDLVAWKSGTLLIIECKPDHDDQDAAKLLSVLEDSSRIELLFEELRQRKLDARNGMELPASYTGSPEVRCALAHAGTPVPMHSLFTLAIDFNGESARWVTPM